MKRLRASFVLRFLTSAIVLTLASGDAFAASRKKSSKSAQPRVTAKSSAKRTRHVRVRRAVYRPMPGPLYEFEKAYIAGGPWTEPSYADSTSGDQIDGEDLEVRQVAVEALDGMNGSVVIVDPTTGRILTMVNQKVALGNGFQPCSTVKVPVALAALSEGLIERTTRLRVYRRTQLNMTEALARSNNHYFAHLGLKLGFEKVSYYARLYGYGEKAGLDIPGERPGAFPTAPPKNGGIGMLSSFGEEISQTPLQFAALMAAMSNGGTLYYLQYPRTQEEAQNLVPRVKRQLEIKDLIPEVKAGMMESVQSGTARRAYFEEPIAGKTGTCTQGRTHLGWFGSFNDVGNRKLAVVVLLTGGKPAIGPTAAGIAGEIYRRLAEQNYFAKTAPFTPATFLSPLPR